MENTQIIYRSIFYEFVLAMYLGIHIIIKLSKVEYKNVFKVLLMAIIKTLNKNIWIHYCSMRSEILLIKSYN